MSDIPLGVKLSCNSLFSSYSNTVMHTDNYSTTACLTSARSNQIYHKLRERDKWRETEMKKGRDGPWEKSKTNSQIISSYLHRNPLLLVCCNCIQCFDLGLCFSFTYLCVMHWRMISEPRVFMQHNLHDQNTQAQTLSGLSLRQLEHGTIASVHCPKIKSGWLAALLICRSPQHPLSSCPLSRHLFNFDTQWSTSISPCESRWRYAERGSCCEHMWASLGPSGGGGETNFKVTSFWEPHFQKVISGWCTRLATGLWTAEFNMQNLAFDILSGGNHNTELHI